jgi:dolichol kinase
MKKIINRLIDKINNSFKGFNGFELPESLPSKDKPVSLEKELLRKANHVLIAILPISYFFFTKAQILYFLIPIGSSIILLDYYRHKISLIGKIFNRIFSKILRDHEKKQLCGASYFSIAALIIFIFLPKIIAINAFLILAISDSLAAIIGKKLQSGPFFEKSIAGSSAFFISAILIIIAIGLIFKETLLYYLFAAMAAFIATIIEARPQLLKMDDNFTIPVSFGLTLMAFNTMWIYN